MPTPIELAQRQLEAYNRRDLEAFLAVFSDDCRLYELGKEAPTTVGKAAMRERYANLFAKSPSLNCVIVNRTALGRAVIDFEQITGRMGEPGVLEAIAIYEIEGDRIARVHFMRK